VQQAEIALLTEFLDARDVGGVDLSSDGKPQRYALAKTPGGGRAETGTSVTVPSSGVARVPLMQASVVVVSFANRSSTLASS
jgi:hypothetical protein